MRNPVTKASAIILILISALFAGSANASPSGPAAIDRAISAQSKYSYVARGRMNLRLPHRVISSDIRVYRDKSGRSRTEYLTAPLDGVVVGHDGTRCWRLDPKLKQVVLMESGSNPDRHLWADLLHRNCKFEIAGNAQVAGRSALLILVRSRDGSVRKRLWLDRSTYVVLKSEDYSQGKGVASSTAYTSIQYKDHLPSSLFQYPRNSYAVVSKPKLSGPMTISAVSHAVGYRVIVPNYVPDGYKLDSYRIHTCPHDGNKSALIRYTNGLDSISVVESKDRCRGCGFSGNNCMMDIAGNGRVLAASVRGMRVVVIANLKPVEMRRVASSIR